MTNKDIARAYFGAIDKKDFAALRGLLAEGHEFHNPMMPKPATADEHIGMVQMMTGALTGEHVLDLLVDDGDHIAIRGRWKGKHTGDFNGIPATGMPVEFTWTDIMEIRNGKIAHEALEMNPMAIMSQIGPPAP